MRCKTRFSNNFVTIFLLFLNMRGLHIFIYYACNFEDVNFFFFFDMFEDVNLFAYIRVIYAVVTPEILSRVFLFHFEKILSHFDLFRDILVNIG